jgi:hypothetical protein
MIWALSWVYVIKLYGLTLGSRVLLGLQKTYAVNTWQKPIEEWIHHPVTKSVEDAPAM